MIPTNTYQELLKAEYDLQRSTVSLLRELGKGNEKSRMHAVTLQALFNTLKEVQALIAKHPDAEKKSIPKVVTPVVDTPVTVAKVAKGKKAKK